MAKHVGEMHLGEGLCEDRRRPMDLEDKRSTTRYGGSAM
jgi:hypothetical protein